MRSFLAVMAIAVARGGCSANQQQTGSGPPSPNIFTALGGFFGDIAARTSPTLAARRDYEKAVANYQARLAANPSNPNACEGQRNIMNADAQILSAPNVSQQSNVYVGRYVAMPCLNFGARGQV